MTVFGQNSVAELRDLTNAKDYTVNQVQSGYDAFAHDWQAKDPETEADWKRDWTTFLVKYKAARALAAGAFGKAKVMIGVRDSLIPAPIEYAAILKALRQTEGVQTKGDLQDLYDRLVAAGAKVDVSKTPQPKAEDVDLSAYKAADTAIKEGKKKVKEAGKGFLADNWGKLLIGAGALYVAKKILP